MTRQRLHTIQPPNGGSVRQHAPTASLPTHPGLPRAAPAVHVGLEYFRFTSQCHSQSEVSTFCRQSCWLRSETSKLRSALASGGISRAATTFPPQVQLKPSWSSVRNIKQPAPPRRTAARNRRADKVSSHKLPLRTPAPRPLFNGHAPP